MPPKLLAKAKEKAKEKENAARTRVFDIPVKGMYDAEVDEDGEGLDFAPGDDHSVLMAGGFTGSEGFQGLYKNYRDGSAELRMLFNEEANFIIECRYCRQFFRHSHAFLAHKRAHCRYTHANVADLNTPELKAVADAKVKRTNLMKGAAQDGKFVQDTADKDSSEQMPLFAVPRAYRQTAISTFDDSIQKLVGGLPVMLHNRVEKNIPGRTAYVLPQDQLPKRRARNPPTKTMSLQDISGFDARIMDRLVHMGAYVDPFIFTCTRECCEHLTPFSDLMSLAYHVNVHHYDGDTTAHRWLCILCGVYRQSQRLLMVHLNDAHQRAGQDQLGKVPKEKPIVNSMLEILNTRSEMYLTKTPQQNPAAEAMQDYDENVFEELGAISTSSSRPVSRNESSSSPKDFASDFTGNRENGPFHIHRKSSPDVWKTKEQSVEFRALSAKYRVNSPFTRHHGRSIGGKSHEAARENDIAEASNPTSALTEEVTQERKLKEEPSLDEAKQIKEEEEETKEEENIGMDVETKRQEDESARMAELTSPEEEQRKQLEELRIKEEEERVRLEEEEKKRLEEEEKKRIEELRATEELERSKREEEEKRLQLERIRLVEEEKTRLEEQRIKEEEEEKRRQELRMKEEKEREAARVRMEEMRKKEEEKQIEERRMKEEEERKLEEEKKKRLEEQRMKEEEEKKKLEEERRMKEEEEKKRVEEEKRVKEEEEKKRVEEEKRVKEEEEKKRLEEEKRRLEEQIIKEEEERVRQEEEEEKKKQDLERIRLEEEENLHQMDVKKRSALEEREQASSLMVEEKKKEVDAARTIEAERTKTDIQTSEAYKETFNQLEYYNAASAPVQKHRSVMEGDSPGDKKDIPATPKDPAPTPAPVATTGPKKRGRKPKPESELVRPRRKPSIDVAEAGGSAPPETTPVPVQRKRGRPRKTDQSTPSTSASSSRASSRKLPRNEASAQSRTHSPSVEFPRSSGVADELPSFSNATSSSVLQSVPDDIGSPKKSIPDSSERAIGGNDDAFKSPDDNSNRELVPPKSSKTSKKVAPPSFGVFPTTEKRTRKPNSLVWFGSSPNAESQWSHAKEADLTKSSPGDKSETSKDGLRERNEMEPPSKKKLLENGESTSSTPLAANGIPDESTNGSPLPVASQFIMERKKKSEPGESTSSTPLAANRIPDESTNGSQLPVASQFNMERKKKSEPAACDTENLNRITSNGEDPITPAAAPPSASSSSAASPFATPPSATPLSAAPPSASPSSAAPPSATPLSAAPPSASPSSAARASAVTPSALVGKLHQGVTDLPVYISEAMQNRTFRQCEQVTDANGKQAHKCNWCDEKLDNAKTAQRHIMSHVRMVRLRCHLCGAGAFFRIDLRNHLMLGLCPHIDRAVDLGVQLLKLGDCVMQKTDADQLIISACGSTPGRTLFTTGMMVSVTDARPYIPDEQMEKRILTADKFPYTLMQSPPESFKLVRVHRTAALESAAQYSGTSDVVDYVDPDDEVAIDQSVNAEIRKMMQRQPTAKKETGGGIGSSRTTQSDSITTTPRINQSNSMVLSSSTEASRSSAGFAPLPPRAANTPHMNSSNGQ